MPGENSMTIDERRTYLQRMYPRYLKADRAGRGRLLDEMEAMTDLHRKSLVRLLAQGSFARRPRVSPTPVRFASSYPREGRRLT